MRRFIILWAIAGAAIFSVRASGAMLQSDDFESGTTEGWTGGAAPTLQATGGPAGLDDAFLLLTADSPFGGPGSKLATYNVGPDWVGDYASLDAGSVIADLMNPMGSPVLEMRLVLFAPSLLLDQRWTSTALTVVPSDGVWRNYEFSLAEEDLTQVTVTGTTLYDVLIDNVARVMLRHDAGSPSFGGSPISASLGIDNVRLVANSPPLTADFNGDDVVDFKDLVQWQGDFGQNGSSDADGDNDSDGSDFLAWQLQFTGNLSTLPASTTVPEPATGIMLILGMATLLSGCQTAMSKLIR